MDLNKGFPLKQQQDTDLSKGFPLKQQQDMDLNKGFPLKQQQDMDLNKGFPFPLKQQQDMDLNKGFPFPLKQQQDMDLNKGFPFPLKQQQDYDIQWAPTTPAKVTSASSQRSQPSGSNWLEPTVMPCQLRGSSSPGLPNHLRGGHHTLATAGHASMGSIIMLHSPSTSSGNANSSECWSPLMYGSDNAICNADGTSKMLSCHPWLVHIDRRWEMPSAQNMFMAKGKLVLAPNLSNNRCSCCDSQTDEYRLPVASIPNCDSLSAPPTPATTEKFNKRAQDKQPSSEVTELVEEWGRGENQMAKEVSLYEPEMKRLRSDRDIPVLYEVTSDRLIRVENSSTDRETKAIDLLGTPNKRPQRKKHRPKVFKEGKPSRTPKLATSPSDMDGSSCKRKYVRRNKDVIHSSKKENTSCRRKYSRRSKDVAHSSNTNAFEEIIETESKGKAKSPRRCLNFDTEDPQAMEEFSAAMLMFKKVLGDRSRDVRDESAATSSSSTKASDSNWVQDQVAVKPSTYQSQNQCLQQIPVPYAEANKNICALDEQIPSLKSSVKHFKALARESACSNSSPKSFSEISQSNLNPLGISDSPPKGMKMCQLSTDEARESAQKRSTHSYNLDSPPKGMKMCHLSTNEARESAQKRITHPYNLRVCSSKSHDAARQNSCLTGVHKAIRMEKWGHSEANPKFSPSWEMMQLSNNSLEFKFADAQRFIAHEKAQILERILAFHQTEKYAIRNAGLDGGLASLSSIRSWGRKSTPTKQFKQKNKDIIQPSTPENKICGNQAHPEKSEDIDKSLQQAQSHLLYSMSSSTKHTCVEVRKAHSNDIYPAQKNANIGVLATRNLNGKKLYLKNISADCQSTSYFNVPTYSSFSSGALAYVDPVDCIVEKLRHLYISSRHEVASSHPQNALVPYARHGFMMVPYDRSFELVKRRRPRAKVDLDPESNRVWKLLMGKDCGEGGEPPDVDKEKWWDEERRVFQGRADSFIARMHLVQGDRRYSQWKGSVVDSVVGVFLTQNVSDHLSSSAFMSLAAKFPLSSRGKFSVPETERVNTSMESQNRSLFDNGLFQSSVEVSASQNGEGKETSNCSEIFGSTTRSSITYYSRQKGKGKGPDSRKKEVILCQESTASGSGINLGETDDIRLTDSQNSVVSSQNSNANLNFEAGDLSGGSMTNALGSASFTELLQMAEITGLKEFCNNNGGMISESQNKESVLNLRNNPFSTSQLENSEDTFQSCNVDSSLHQAELSLSDMLLPEPSQSDDLFNSKEKIRSHLQTTSSEISSCNFFEFMSGKCGESEGSVVESTLSHKMLSSFTTTMNDSTRTQTTQNITLTEMDVRANLLSANHKNTAADAIDTSKNENLEVRVSLETEVMERFQQKDENSIFKEERTRDSVQPSDEPCRNQQAAVSNNQTECNFDMPDRVGPNLKAEICSFPKTSPETANSAINTRKTKKSTYDWESLRKEVCCSKPAEERSSMTMDSLDWEAVRTADVSKVAEAIRARGMNNVLAERIQEFLNRLVREHGSIDLEWLRDVSPDKVKDYLLSIRGLGLKSAECVRLLTLRQLAFPVDTNVGRICVRLGWVPLQPLPESLQLHLLELYPVLATIQKYLWPRLCKLDQRTLYELHYQMITFGKVFCTKSKPNCNSCPMRGECRHFASAFASARLALPAPEDKSLLSLTSPIASDESPSVFLNLRPFPQIEESLYSQEPAFQNNGEPIIEEPASPEPECQKSLESAIEDAFYEDPEEIPTIKLNLTEFTKNLRNYMEENMELQDGSLSKALVTLTPEAASIPMPKLKNVSRLRTEHQVYEIPDTHPLLEGLDPREPDDPSPYLLAIWTPGETAQSTEPPKADCNFQDVGQPCERSTCFGCNSMREAESHKIRGTLLIPCRTAMRGSFPLNGTYFQVNEVPGTLLRHLEFVFADHHSSREPVYILRDWIWNLPRRTVYFGTSIPTIFKGLTTEGIQQCFWRGFVCVRGFDRETRAPKPLYARLHFPASKATKNRNVGEPKVEKNGSN